MTFFGGVEAAVRSRQQNGVRPPVHGGTGSIDTVSSRRGKGGVTSGRTPHCCRQQWLGVGGEASTFVNQRFGHRDVRGRIGDAPPSKWRRADGHSPHASIHSWIVLIPTPSHYIRSGGAGGRQRDRTSFSDSRLQRQPEECSRDYDLFAGQRRNRSLTGTGVWRSNTRESRDRAFRAATVPEKVDGSEVAPEGEAQGVNGRSRRRRRSRQTVQGHGRRRNHGFRFRLGSIRVPTDPSSLSDSRLQCHAEEQIATFLNRHSSGLE